MASYQRLRNDPQNLVDRTDLNNIELAALGASNQLLEDTIASSIPLRASVHESSDAESPSISQSLAESRSSTPSSESRNTLPDYFPNAISSE